MADAPPVKTIATKRATNSERWPSEVRSCDDNAACLPLLLGFASARLRDSQIDPVWAIHGPDEFKGQTVRFNEHVNVFQLGRCILK
jgi:hypothetical protein